MKSFRQFTYKDIVIKIHRMVFLIPKLAPLDVLEKFFSIVPETVYKGFLNKMLIGHFSELAKHKKTAGYKNGTIFVSSFLEEGNHEKKYGQQNPNVELLKNLIHETGHVFEENYYDMLNMSPALNQEFITARKKVSGIFGREQDSWVVDPRNDSDATSFLDEVGFNVVRAKTIGFIPNPNCILNISEFIAYCFEEYVLRDKPMVEKLSPTIFAILTEVFHD